MIRYYIRKKTTKRTRNERAIIGAKAVWKLTLVNIADGQSLLTEFLLLLPRLLLVHRATGQLVRFKGAKLELRVKVETRWTGLRPGLPIATEVKLATGVRVRVETVRAWTCKGLFIVCIRVVVLVASCMWWWGVGAVSFRWLLGAVVAAAGAARARTARATSGPGSTASGLRR